MSRNIFLIYRQIYGLGHFFIKLYSWEWHIVTTITVRNPQIRLNFTFSIKLSFTLLKVGNYNGSFFINVLSNVLSIGSVLSFHMLAAVAKNSQMEFAFQAFRGLLSLIQFWTVFLCCILIRSLKLTDIKSLQIKIPVGSMASFFHTCFWPLEQSFIAFLPLGCCGLG